MTPEEYYYRNKLNASSDPFSGYASWILPGIEYELAIQRTKKLKEWDTRYAKAITDLAQKMRKMSAN